MWGRAGSRLVGMVVVVAQGYGAHCLAERGSGGPRGQLSVWRTWRSRGDLQSSFGRTVGARPCSCSGLTQSLPDAGPLTGAAEGGAAGGVADRAVVCCAPSLPANPTRSSLCGQ
jgi:hypothetical protein